jgi:phage terminase large subunit-like protein
MSDLLERYEQALDQAVDLVDVRALNAALLEELELHPINWLRFFFPQFVSVGFAPHHVEFWDFVWSILPDEYREAFLAIWPRGGAKSTSVELAVAALGARARRAYVLYCSGTQDQADRHVATIATLLESSRIGVFYPAFGQPAVGKFGNPKGWRRNRLTTASGFVVDAVGLDTAARGIKVDQQRPDVIVLDDLDDGTDSPHVTETKINRLTRTILPTGTKNTIVFGAQNIVLPNGIFARLAGVAEQPADFLATAHVSGPIPAVDDLVLEQLPPDDRGRPRWQIVSGTPSWDGQGLVECQHEIDTYGKTAFLIECQHQAQLRSGGIFRAWDWMEHQIVDEPFGEGPHIRRMRGWDTAGTEDTGMNDPDWTVGVLLALDTTNGRYRIEHVVRWRAASGTTKKRARRITMLDAAGIHPRDAQYQLPALDSPVDEVKLIGQANFARVASGVEEEPGWHGRDWAKEWIEEVFAGFTAYRIPAFNTKPQRAEYGANIMENQLVTMVQGTWRPSFLAELEAFPDGDHDDQVDAFAHSANWLRRYAAVDSGTGAAALSAMRRPPRPGMG